MPNVSTVCAVLCRVGWKLRGRNSETWLWSASRVNKLYCLVTRGYTCMTSAGKNKNKGPGRNVPALHSGLKQDHVLKGLPALGSPDLVALERGCEGRRQLNQSILWRELHIPVLHQGVNSSCTCVLTVITAKNTQRPRCLALLVCTIVTR